MKERTKETHVLFLPEKMELLNQKMKELGVVNRSAYGKKKYGNRETITYPCLVYCHDNETGHEFIAEYERIRGRFDYDDLACALYHAAEGAPGK